MLTLLVFACLVGSMVGCMSSASAHQLGFIPTTAVIGVDDSRLSRPKDPGLYINGDLTETNDALIRIGYWRPDVVFFKEWKRPIKWDRFLLDPTTSYDLGKAYMIIDVSPLHKYTALGTKEPDEFRARLNKIAELLLIAADHNGEIYWRMLVADLETLGLAESAADILIGGGIPSAFISPALGATLTGIGLAIDTFKDSYIDGLEVNEYASLRESASLYRKAVAGEIFKEIEQAEPGKNAVQSVLNLANDYAFSYSIKGALYAVQKQNEELQNLLVTGESAWKPFFQAQRNRYEASRTSDLKTLTQTLEAEIQYLEERIKKRELLEEASGLSGSGEQGESQSGGPPAAGPAGGQGQSAPAGTPGNLPVE